MPGTNFCGSGYSAEKFSSLGAFGAADKCCRQHDLGCPAYITPLTAKYGLYNWRMYTVMHCSCDARYGTEYTRILAYMHTQVVTHCLRRFRSCLKMASSRTADMVGRMFFNMVQIPCFTFEEADVCTLWTWWGRCKKKERQTTAVLRTAVPY